ncbi:MAG: GspE/PulE family protein [Patescibacteria group bacterium]|jgi:type II secretory ATPase GspE/PulE/Tfp pilus assembly ATPase PilB-like protein
MPNNQSIEDLIKSSNKQTPQDDDESAPAQFAKKQEEIKIKEVERQAEERASVAGFSYINLFGFPISPEAISLISEEESQRLQVVCFLYDGRQIRLGAVNPSLPEIVSLTEKIEKDYHSRIERYLISSHSFNYAVKIYSTLPKIEKAVKGVKISEEDLEKFKNEIEDYKTLAIKINKVNITDVITLLLATALKTDTSDIHVETEENKIVVRLRVDGVLQEAAEIEKTKWKLIVSRLKLLAKAKMNITDKPQDGRFSIILTGEKIEVRVSFLPTNQGESVVLRLLRSSAISLSFEDLGLRPKTLEILKQEISKPNGLVLATGPTGSGKTTTLYAILKKLNTANTKIITLEDPIEYQLEGMNQSQIDSSKGYTFASGLRSALRQDPDIVMVGEIRDLETAEIAIQASLTGHLVLSTLHTNDSSGVLPRLIDMGVKPYFMTPAINCIIGQRLVRRLCPECRVEHILSDSEGEQVEKILAVISPKSGEEAPTAIPKIHKAGAGCPACHGLGYKGRVGIYEIFSMSEKIKELVAANTPAFKILEAAIEGGMLTMLQDGILKVFDGLTSLEEIYRVIGKMDYIDALYDVAISKTFGRGVKLSETNLQKAEELSANMSAAEEFAKSSSSHDLLNAILALSLKMEAGDIHIEPGEETVNVRFRIDGVLQDIFALSKEHYLPILSQVKIMSGFPTNIKKPTYDGRFTIFSGEKKIDCRVSIISGGYGETIVVRLLSSQAEALDMEKLGMRPYALSAMRRAMSKTRGVIINTGPTGSGKTTTLYSILNALNKPDVKIITVEDPIEYHLNGVMQTQVNVEEGYTFAAALRSLLRQNPNIMMIGEIRDEETAKIAVEASLTGHLVLSTIHANSAAGAVFRFAGLGVARDLLASALECAIGQRLVRKICPKCKKEIELPAEQLAEVKKIITSINLTSGALIPEELKFYTGAGCLDCHNLGYKGRLGVYEVVELTPEIKKQIQVAGTTDYEIEQAAIASGAVTMLQDGILKALAGETSIEEVFRTVK